MKIKESIKIKTSKTTIVAQLEVCKKYDQNNQNITQIKLIIIENIKTCFKFQASIFAVLAGITKKAHISNIQKIFIEIQIKIDKNIINEIL